MRSSIVKAKLRNNQPVCGISLHLLDPSVYELASMFGFDFIWMDLEHHATSVETANQLMRAARVGTSDIMARPAKGEFMRLGRILEAGAHGILYPRCESAAEAREVVRWSKFAPLGTRGFDGGNPDMPYCQMEFAEYVRKANDETWIAIQIEDQKGLDQVDEIAAVEGVDIVMLGPADFSLLSGFPGQFTNPKIDEALKAIAAAAKRHGKVWGTVGGSLPRVKELVERGAGWTTYGCDLIWVLNGLKQVQADLATIGLGPAKR